jgi:hypothetical protein
LLLPGSGLHHDSILFCEERSTIDRTFLEEGPRGRVGQDLLDQVVITVRRALSDLYLASMTTLDGCPQRRTA